MDDSITRKKVGLLLYAVFIYAVGRGDESHDFLHFLAVFGVLAACLMVMLGVWWLLRPAFDRILAWIDKTV